MDSHDTTDISGQIAPARSDCKIFVRIKAVRIDHEVAIVFIDRRRLAAIPIVEKLRHGFPLNVVDFVHVEPPRITRNDDSVPLSYQI